MKETEVITRLDRIIELLQNMHNDEIKLLRHEMKELHDWKVTSMSVATTKSNFLQLFRWLAPWVIAFIFILFEHKFKIL